MEILAKLKTGKFVEYRMLKELLADIISVDDVLLVGVGVNWCEAPKLTEQRTASVHQYVERPSALTLAQDALLRAVDGALDWWASQGNEALRARWWQLAERHPVRSQDHEGVPLGLAEDGALRLQDASGAVHEVRAGEVEVFAP